MVHAAGRVVSRGILLLAYAILLAMMSGPKQAGFTIVETLIFLAVSAGILIAALTLVNGSQSKTSFTEGMRDIDQRLTTVINNVANGYYPRISDISCTDAGVGRPVTITVGSEARGSEGNCIFIGRVASFTKGADSFTVYSVAGLRQYYDGTAKVEANSMEHARPNVLPDAEVIQLKNGIELLQMRWTDGTPTDHDTGAVGFFTSFGVNNVSGELQSGSLTSNFAGISGTDPDSTPDNVKDRIASSAWWPAYDAEKNPAGGVELCFKSGTTNQVGSIKIGGQNQSANITQTIKTGSACW